ncbi:hypothetical protein AB205_0075610 [Aquarana catesbeiana]|uniref:Uncharacterized protein n=1 Tax=Aquarana catesbeiana TaxID=8400 RepID=A0A2G9QBE0_AQUCT|nr:hypothetical protein AB205_0075610 [Aquarana catesbeiana]
MFHIPISAIKYLRAKYTFFCLHRGKKTRRTPLIRGDNRPPHLMKKWKSHKHNRRRRETWWKLSPQQVIVMLWMKVISPVKVPRS